MFQKRSSIEITWRVWHALFMREMSSRLFTGRASWFWLFAEPVLFILIMVGIRILIKATDYVAGAHMIPWLTIGLVGFFMFRDAMLRSIGAIDANKVLFTHRQVFPIDTVIARSYVEGVVRTGVLFILLFVLFVLGFNSFPVNPVSAVYVWLSIWMLGFSLGLVLSAWINLIPEVGKITGLFSLPLLIISGAMFPIQYLPYSVQEWLLLNPVLHGIEALRVSFFDGYWTLSSIDMNYLLKWVLAAMALGVLSHAKYETKIKRMH